MFLRSGTDWHLDVAGIHTFEAFLDDQGITAEDVDPVPIDVFLAYAAWFQAQKGIVVRDAGVSDLRAVDGELEAVMTSGTRITADAVVAAPGVASCQALPASPAPACSSWAAARARTSGRRSSEKPVPSAWTSSTATTNLGSTG
jgi:glycine/D-amino acid oxidase-like deaminating enzyme